MSSIEEWQAELNGMFPNGATIFRAQTPEGARRAETSFISTQITVIDVEDDDPVVEVYPIGTWFESFIVQMKSIRSANGGYLIMTGSLSNPATLWLPRQEAVAA